MQKDTKTQGKSGSKEYAHLLKLYLDEKSRAKAIALAQDDLKSLDMIVQFETMLALNKRSAAAQRATKFALATHEVMEIAEQFFSVDDPHLMEKMLSKNKVWQKLKTSDADFSLFQDILSFLFTWFEKPLIPTPAYLKQIIMNRLQTAAPAPTTGAIVIRIKEGLRLIAGHVRNLYDLANTDQMVAVRGAIDTAVAPTGALQFMTTEANNSGELIYQVVKDGKDTVMLTVKLQNYRPRPQFINLRRDGRLLQSLPLHEDFAWFAQLTLGEYELELLNNSLNNGKKIDIHIV